MTSEQQIQTKIKSYLEDQGAYVIKVIAASKKGVPDLVACYKGLFVAIEVKKPTTKNNVSKLQQYNLDKINKLGGIGLVAWSVEQIEELINELSKVQIRR